MGTTKRFLMNAVLLSAVSVAARFITVSFNAHVAMKVGEECMGLFSLVASVFSLSVIIASAGANLAVVRTVSETVAKCESEGIDPAPRLRRIVRAASLYSLLFGAAAGGAVYIFSEPIAVRLLCDERCIMSLRAFAVSLPAISLSSALAGYFTGIGKVYKNAICTFAEEAGKILVISAGLVLIAPRGIEYACLAIVGGGAAAQALSLVTAIVIYITDKKKRGGSKEVMAKSVRSVFGKIAKLALPVAVGNAARNGLITAEHLAIPRGLRAFGMTNSAALAVYGVFQGMVMPVVLFPSAVLYSFAGLLIPELASCRAVGNTERIARIEEKVFRSSLLFSICVAGILLSFSDGIGYGLYESAEASRQISLLALLIPVMYLDSAVDGMLKGLGEEVYCMRVNVLDSALCLVLVFILVPKFGIDGFIALTIISELVNAALSIIRLLKIAPVKFNIFKWLFLPAASVSAATFAVKLLSSSIPSAPLTLRITLAVILYGVLCFATGAVGKRDARWFFSLFKNRKIKKQTAV